MNLKNTILNFYREIVLADIAATVVNLVIEGRNEAASELRIAGYEQLETIEILSNSLQNVHLLIITNNPLLKSVVCGENACEYVLKVEISRLFDLIHSFDLPQLTTFTTGDFSFYHTTSLSLTSLIDLIQLIRSSSIYNIHYRT